MIHRATTLLRSICCSIPPPPPSPVPVACEGITRTLPPVDPAHRAPSASGGTGALRPPGGSDPDPRWPRAPNGAATVRPPATPPPAEESHARCPVGSPSLSAPGQPAAGPASAGGHDGSQPGGLPVDGRRQPPCAGTATEICAPPDPGSVSAPKLASQIGRAHV